MNFIKKFQQEWQAFKAGIMSSTPVDKKEKTADKIARIAKLEADPEEWFKYYFPKFCTRPDGTFIDPAQFHLAATARVLAHMEWFEMRNWARESAKSVRTMEEVLYLVLTGKKKNVILTSNSEDNACRLLQPYKINLEANNRIINDYELQENVGAWTDYEFVTKKGVAFRALGAGQSPRGTRNEASRPDVILIDDIDTDEDCRNAEIIDKRVGWIQEALIPTRSISTPLLIIMCGNIIAEDCCVTRMAPFAAKDPTKGIVDKVNIRDEAGRSTWPAKNTEAAIDRVLSLISYESQQKEYFNNPMVTGKTFAELIWGECPPLSELPFVVCYSDPSSSNKDRPGQSSNLTTSRKATFVVGRKGNKYYIYHGFLDVMSSSHFIDSIYACRDYINNGTLAYFYVENNTLQDPIYSQIYLPLIYQVGQQHPHGVLGITPDTRDKKDKWFRIEAALEPVNRLGNLIFNIKEKDSPHMQRLVAQFKTAKATSKQLDGPDCIEGAKYIIDQKLVTNDIGSYSAVPRSRSSSKYC